MDFLVRISTAVRCPFLFNSFSTRRIFNDYAVIGYTRYFTCSRTNPIQLVTPSYKIYHRREILLSSLRNIPWIIIDRLFNLFPFRFLSFFLFRKNNASIERRDKMHEFRVFLFSFPPLALHPVIPLRGGTLFIVSPSSIFYLHVILASSRRAAVHPVKISLGKLNGFTSRMEVPNKVFPAY